MTGGSLGIGRAIARETNAHCVAVPADLTNVAQLQAAMAGAQEALGRVDILVNNAGATPTGPSSTPTG